MKKEVVLEILSQPGRQISREALLEIQSQPEVYRKHLLKVLKREAAKPQKPTERIEYNDWLYAIYLLAESREKEAYRSIIKLFSRKGNFLNPLTGDIVLQNLGQILASVADGNSLELKKMIENAALNEYCRASAIEALVIMVEMKEYTREELYHYFNELFKKLEQIPIFPWSVLCQSAIFLYKKAFLKEVKQAFHNGLVDEIYIDLEEIQAYIADPEISQLALIKKKYGIIVDAIAAMEWWTNFKDDKEVV